MQQRSAIECQGTCGKPGCCAEKLSDSVGSAGGRLTKERILLLQVSCEMGAHFTPEGIQKSLAARGSRMAMTTIYRNLPALERAGIIQRTTFKEEDKNGASTYEHIWRRPHHDHLVCQGCGKKIEFQYDALEVLQEEVARKHGFRLTSHHLELVGVCPDCARAEHDREQGANA